MLPVSNDTVLRVVRAQTRPRPEPLNVVGIDDWAYRRNYGYGTIVCDLERRRIVTLLPDREVATVQAWLADHPNIKVLSEIVVPDMAKRLRGHCLARSRLQIAGILWKTRALRS